MAELRKLLGFLALLSLAAVPAGYMPERLGDGTIVLRICGGTKPARQHDTPGHADMGHAAHSAAGHHHDTQDSEQSGETRCDYAVASIAHRPYAPVLPVSVDWAPIRNPTAQLSLAGIYPTGLPPSTGPPSV